MKHGPQTLVLFAHGKESGPWGTKIQYLASLAGTLGATVLSPDYRDLPDPDARANRLLSLPMPPHNQLIMVGSSMGAYVSTLAARQLKPAGLFLMAPAFYLPGYAEQNPSIQQTEISVDHGIRFARRHNAALHILDSDHRLNSVILELGQIFETFIMRLIGNAPCKGGIPASQISNQIAI